MKTITNKLNAFLSHPLRLSMAIAIMLCVSLVNKTSAQTVFAQDFSASSVVTDYVNATTPGSTLFNAVTNSGTSSATISSGMLQFTRASASNGFTRTTDFSPVPSIAMVKFDLKVSATPSSGNNSTVATFQVGSGFTSNASVESNPSTYARLAIDFRTGSQWRLSDVSNGNTSSSFAASSTVRSITWVMNNTSGTISYLAPNGTIETLTTDDCDVWIDNTIVFDDVNCESATQTIADLKFAFTSSAGTIAVDNFVIKNVIIPQVSAFSGNTICSGQTGQLTLTTSAGSGGPYNITYTDPTARTITGVSSGVAFNAAVASASTTNITLTSITDPTGGVRNGSFTDASATITVTAPGASAGAALPAICMGGTSAALGGSVSGSATGGTWSDNGVGGTFNSGATNLNTTWTPPPAYTGTATLTLTSSGGACTPAATASKNIQVLQPATASAGGSQTICSSSVATVSGASSSNGTIAWTSNGPGVLTNTTTLTPTYTPGANDPTQTVTLTMTVSNAGCSATATYTVFVLGKPTVAALTGTQTICATATTTFSSATNGGVWSTDNSGIATVSAGVVTGVSAGTTNINYTVTDANGCFRTVSRSVTVNPLPTTVVASGATAICPSTSTTLTGSAVIPYLQTTTINSDNFNGTPTYTSSTGFAQKANNASVGGTAMTNNIDASSFMATSIQSTTGGTVTVNAQLTSPSFSTVGISSPITFTFHHTLKRGNTGTNTAVVQVSTNNGGTWTTVKTYGADVGGDNSFQLESTINLDTYANTSNLMIRFNTTLTAWIFNNGWWVIDNPTLKGNGAVAPLYSWTANTASGINGLPAGAANASTANASISVNPTADTNYTLTATDPNTGCATVGNTIAVTIKPTPVANAVTSSTYCNGISAASIPLTGSPSGVTFDISGGTAIGLANVNNVTSIPSFTTVAGTANITITPKANGCTGAPITYQVIVNPTPTVTAPSNQSYCISDVTAPGIALAGTPAGVTYDISGGASVGLADATNVTSIPSFTMIEGNATVSITPHANNCAGVTKTYTIVVNPNPIATAPSDQVYCNGTATAPIALTGTPAGVTFDISGGASIGLANENNVTSIPSFNATAGSAIISITPKANGCTGTAVTYNVLVNPTPTTNAVSNQTYCTGIATAPIALSGTPSGVTFDISGGAAIGLADATNVTSIPSFTTMTGNATISITPNANGCTGNVTTYAIVVNPVPTVNSPGDQTYCNGFNSAAMTLTGTPSGVTFNISGGASIGLANATNVTAIPSFTPSTGNATITLTPMANGCMGTPVTFEATVNPIVTPTFTQASPICSGDSLSALPTTSNNGITGTWSPALNNTQTTTYTFTPTPGLCANAVNMTIVVNTNTTYYADTDGDGYGDATTAMQTCLGQPIGYVTNGTDCDVNDTNVYRTGTFYVDTDMDGYNDGSAPQTLCYGDNAPTGLIAENNGVDCNDFNAEINPWHVETLTNGVDDNCDGSIDEVGPVTVITASQCGTTLSNIANTIYVSTYAAATGYRFQVTNGSNVRLYDTSLNRMSLVDLPGGATYNTTYSIRVSLLINGFWQAYGASCNITTPSNPATTNVIASMCGTTLSSMATTIYCNQVSAANQYRFEISDGVNTPLTIDTALNRFNMASISGTLYATTYAVRVALRFGSTWEDYGTSCNITTPAGPATTQVIPSQCGSTVNSFWTTIYAQNVNEATGYRFEVSDGATTRYVDSSVNRFALRQLTGTVSASTVYTIRVAILFNSVYQPFGSACTITTSSVATGRHSESAVAIFDVTVAPNPCVDSFRINMNTSSEENVTYKAYDMLGREVESKEINANELGETALGAQFPSGVYNIIVAQGDNVKTLRVIKR